MSSYRRYGGYYGSSEATSSYGSSYGSTGRGLYGSNYSSTPRYGTSSYTPRSTSVDRSSSKDRAGHYGSSDYSSYRSLGNLPSAYSSNTRKSYGGYGERTTRSGSISDYSSWDRGSRYGSSAAQDSSSYYTPRAKREYPSYSTNSTYLDRTNPRSRSMDARSSYNRQISHESVNSERDSYTKRNAVIPTPTPKCKDYPQPPYDQPWSCSESDSAEELLPPDLERIRKEGRFVTSRGTSPPPSAGARKSRRSISRRKRQFFPKEKVRIEIDGRVLIGEAAPMPKMDVRVQTSPVRDEDNRSSQVVSSPRGSGFSASDTYLKYSCRYGNRQNSYQSSHIDKTPSRSSYRSDRTDASERSGTGTATRERDRDGKTETAGSWRNKVYGEEKRRSPSPEHANRGSRRRTDSDYQSRGRRRQGSDAPSDSYHGTDQTSMKESIEKVRSWRKYLDTSLDDSASVSATNQRLPEEQLSPACTSPRPSDGSRTRSQKTRGTRDGESPDASTSTPHHQQQFFRSISTESEFVKDTEDKSFRKSKLNMSDDVFISDLPPTSPRLSVSDKTSVKQSQYSPRSRAQSRQGVQQDGRPDVIDRQESIEVDEKLLSSDSRADATNVKNAISASAYTSRCRDIDDLLADTKFSDDEQNIKKPVLPSDVQMLLVKKSWSKLNIVDLMGICHKQRPPESSSPHMFKGYKNIDDLLLNFGVDVDKLEDCALQLYRYNGSEGEYGSYLDLDYSLNEQWEELEGFNDERRNVIILRTKLTVRVLACIEKLMSSSGRELRRSLFSLKPIFQDDKDLVHEFVNQGGLECLIKIGLKSDHNHQNYILRALGQVMLYVDGMQGIVARNVTIQWLYSLTASKFRGVAKAAAKLLIVFLNYGDSNEDSQFKLITQAVETVHQETGTKQWSYLIDILKEEDGADVELQKIAMTFINQLLAGVPDQDTFYDITDALEELGMESICDHHLSKQGADLDLTQQVYLYSMALKVEDGDEENVDGQIRRQPKARSETENRKSRRSMDQGRMAQRGESPLAVKEPESTSTEEAEEASTSGTESARDRGKTSTPTQDASPARFSSDQNDLRTDNRSIVSSSTLHVRLSACRMLISPDPAVLETAVGPAMSVKRRRDRRHRQRSLIIEQEKARRSSIADVVDDDDATTTTTTVGGTSREDVDRDVDEKGTDAETNDARSRRAGNVTEPKFTPSEETNVFPSRPLPPIADCNTALQYSNTPYDIKDITVTFYRRASESMPKSRYLGEIGSGGSEQRRNSASVKPDSNDGRESLKERLNRLYAEPIKQPQPYYSRLVKRESTNSEVNGITYRKLPRSRETVTERKSPDGTGLLDDLKHGPLHDIRDMRHELRLSNALHVRSNKEDEDVSIGTPGHSGISKEGTPCPDPPVQAGVTDSTSDTNRDREASESDQAGEKPSPKENIAARFERMERMRSPSVEKTLVDGSAVEGSVKLMHDKLTNADVSVKENGAKGPFGDVSGLIMKAKDELSSASFNKAERTQQIPDVKPPPRKTEDEMQWDVFKENLLNQKITLRIGDFDFTDLHEEDDENCLEPKPSIPACGIPPPPSLPNWMPPPPPPIPGVPGAPPPPPPPPNFQSAKNMDCIDGLPPPPGSDAVKTKKTVRLHWKEVNPNRVLPVVKDTIWSQVVDVKLDYDRLQHLFETRTTETRLKKVAETKKEIVVLNTKRSNAINIGMTVLPPPRTIKAAILRMDTSIISREGIEKILTMIPTEEERNLIMEAQVSNPDTPLGPAEQFLLTLSSVTELEARLQLWAFKLDYELNEKEMLEHLSDLKSAIESMYTNKTFVRILSVLLGVGNYLNGTRSHGFTIDYLSKVPEVRDTVHKHSLLHHLVAIVHEQFPETSDLYSDIGAVTRSSKVDWDELTEKLNHMENDCKKSFLNLRAISKHDSNSSTKAILTEFLQDCRKRIMMLRVVHTRVINRFRKLLLFLGMPSNMAKDVKVNTFCKSLSEFALEYRTTREKIITQNQKRQNNRERKKTRGKMIFDANDSPDNSVKKNSTNAGLLHNPPRRLSPSSAASSAVSDDDDRLQAVLYHDRGGSESGRESIYGSLGRKRLSAASTGYTTQRPSSGYYNSSQATDSDVRGDETGEDQDELLEACVKTASSSSSRRVKEKRRARNTQRKSLRRTLKSGLKEDEIQVIAEYV